LGRIDEMTSTSRELYAPSSEGEGRLLLLIDAFSKNGGTLQGRTKLAKLDFLLRYPLLFEKAMTLRGIQTTDIHATSEDRNIETRMVRFRYGPWDPAHYAILGSLIGRGLVEAVREERAVTFRTTGAGKELAGRLGETAPWSDVLGRAVLLRKAFATQKGTFLKKWIYDNFPEVTRASWGEPI
jgi:hypothetical protein